MDGVHHHGGVARPGDFYDQDREGRPPPRPNQQVTGPRRARSGFFDQDEDEADPSPPAAENRPAPATPRPRRAVDIYALRRAERGLTTPAPGTAGKPARVDTTPTRPAQRARPEAAVPPPRGPVPDGRAPAHPSPTRPDPAGPAGGGQPPSTTARPEATDWRLTLPPEVARELRSPPPRTTPRPTANPPVGGAAPAASPPVGTPPAGLPPPTTPTRHPDQTLHADPIGPVDRTLSEAQVPLTRATAPTRGEPPVLPSSLSRPPAPTRPDDARSRAGAGLIGRNAGLLAAGTFLSRVTGFVRTLTVLAVLGAKDLGDAYNLANTVPNIIYELILGGVLSATMIPVFVDQFRREDREAGNRSISAVLTAIIAVLLVVTGLLIVFAPLVIHFYLSFNHQVTGGDERAVGTSLLRLFAPQVFFLGAIVVTTALLNARRHFAAAAFSPVVNNLIMIGAILATKVVASTVDIAPFRHDHSAILVLGLGTTLGYAVQFLIHIPALSRAGVRFRPVWDLRDPAVRQITRLSSWLVGVVLANQVSLTIVIILSAQVAGSYTIYNSAYTFFQLPYALFAVSVASVLTPDLAERWSSGDRKGFQRRMVAGARITLAVLIPAGIGYAIVARPVIILAAEHGATTGSSAKLIGTCLALFALGLPGYSAFLLLMRGLQAMQDAKAMFLVYLLENALSVVLAFALYPSLGVRGLCLAWVAPYTICSFVAVAQLHRRMGSLGGATTIRALLRVSIATAIMAVGVFAAARVMPHGGGDTTLIVRLAAEVVAGTVLFLYAARVFGVVELDPVFALIRRLLGRTPPGGGPRHGPRHGPRPSPRPESPPSQPAGRRPSRARDGGTRVPG